MHRKNVRDLIIALLCKPRENESRQQIVALKALGATVETMSDVVLSRARLPFLEKWCTELGLSNEPVIFQTEADAKARKTSILGKGHHAAEDSLWWIISKMSVHSCIFKTVALLISPALQKTFRTLIKTSTCPLGTSRTASSDVLRQCP